MNTMKDLQMNNEYTESGKYNSVYCRNRYRTDEEFRRRRIETVIRWRKEHKDQVNKWQKDYIRRKNNGNRQSNH